MNYSKYSQGKIKKKLFSQIVLTTNFFKINLTINKNHLCLIPSEFDKVSVIWVD